MKRSAIALLILAIFFSPALAQKINVGASIFPIYDWVRIIGGERVDAFVLLQPGKSPHTFELLPQDAERISKSKAFFVIGKGLETWLENYARSAGSDAGSIVRLAEGIDGRLMQIGYSGELLKDPHLWLDPMAAKIMVARIADRLCGIDPAGCDTYKSNLAKYAVVLDQLTKELQNLGSEFRGRKIVTHHNAFRQFLLRSNGLGLLGVVETSPDQEPSSAHIKELIVAMKAAKVRVVFEEPLLSSREAKIIASEVGGVVMTLDPIESGPSRDTSYEKLIRYDIDEIRKALTINK